MLVTYKMVTRLTLYDISSMYALSYMSSFYRAHCSRPAESGPLYTRSYRAYFYCGPTAGPRQVRLFPIREADIETSALLSDRRGEAPGCRGKRLCSGAPPPVRPLILKCGR